MLYPVLKMVKVAGKIFEWKSNSCCVFVNSIRINIVLLKVVVVVAAENIRQINLTNAAELKTLGRIKMWVRSEAVDPRVVGTGGIGANWILLSTKIKIKLCICFFLMKAEVKKYSSSEKNFLELNQNKWVLHITLLNAGYYF